MKSGPSKLALRWLHLATLVLALAGIGNIYSHICLDGQEPPRTVHFENFDTHTEHEEGTYIADVESKAIPQGLVVKNQSEDSQLFVLVVSLVIGLQAPQHRHSVEPADVIVLHEPFAVLPPPRAPPVYSS